MDLQPVTMGKFEAQQAYLTYRRHLHERRTREDEEILKGYRALARGQKLITLRDVMTRAGRHVNGLPKLAVARADSPRVDCYTNWGWATFLSNQATRYGRTAKDNRIQVHNLPNISGEVDGTAIVPIIPPQYRPPQDQLSSYHILFEADWKLPPKDPALLKRLGKDLWAVVAVWDLTELERAVLLSR